MEIENILVVDDEPLIRKLIQEILTRMDYNVFLANHGEAALKIIKNEDIDLVITDLQMPVMDGLTLLKQLHKEQPHLLVIIATAYASIENVIEALRLGAYDYLLKPITPQSIEAVLNKAKGHQKLIRENAFLKKEHSSCRTEHRAIARSQSMLSILKEISVIAKSNASVFIHGESGSGKEVIAQELHRQSNRATESFIRVNCPAISPTLLESEFFGHEKGAFTGAESKKIGRLELANLGTLFLDEVTEIPLALQPKFLRAIQEKEFERVGSSKPIQTDVRFIATSNRDMKKAIGEGVFRSDLYYRLNVIPIEIPPLRHRKDDILPLAEHFLAKLGSENHRKKLSFDKNAQTALLEYNWPGNVRELINVIERTVVLSTQDVITRALLRLDNTPSKSTQEHLTLKEKIKESEKHHILQILHEASSQKDAAKSLGLTPAMLLKKLKEHALAEYTRS